MYLFQKAMHNRTDGNLFDGGLLCRYLNFFLYFSICRSTFSFLIIDRHKTTLILNIFLLLFYIPRKMHFHLWAEISLVAFIGTFFNPEVRVRGMKYHTTINRLMLKDFSFY